MRAFDRRHVCDERGASPGEGVEAEARTDRVDVGPKLGDLDDLDRRDPRDEGVVGEREAEGERRTRGPDGEADCPRESSEDPMEEHRRLLEGDKWTGARLYAGVRTVVNAFAESRSGRGGYTSAYSSARIERRTSFRCWAAITVPRTTGARLSACRSVFMWAATTVPPTAGAGPVPCQLRLLPGRAVFIACRGS